MGVSPFFVRMGVRTDRTPWKGMLSGSPPAEAEPDSIPLPRLVHPARKKCRLTDRLWVVSASLDDCRG